jgi:hypothetical protein
MSNSKALGHDDSSGFEFAKEMLGNIPTAAINFDRIQKHPEKGYIIFEYLLCEEDQPRVTPYTSHPNLYWEKDKNKFLLLWELSQKLNATLYLVNYAKKGSKHEDEILVIKVQDMNEGGIQKEEKREMNRQEFKHWFRQLNTESLGKRPCPNCGAPLIKKQGKYGKFLGCADYKNTGCRYTEKI